ncbi:MAG: DNA pilot protein [Microvirus sp.]|nr:MAG: DNA pilot protein [Microvirus sp.]
MGLFDIPIISDVVDFFQNERTNAANKKMVDSTNQANLNLWREQAAYNQPIENMKRLEAAGLSPHLAYGQVADSKLGAAPMMQAPHFERPPDTRFADKIAQHQQVVNMQEQNKLIRSQNQAAEAEAEYKKYETDYLIKNEMLRNDTGIVRSAQRIPDIVGDRVDKFIKWMENENERHYREQLERKQREKENK